MLRKLHTNMSNISFYPKDTETNHNEGIRYMEMAAEAGDRSAMIHMAKAYDTGNGLGTDR